MLTKEEIITVVQLMISTSLRKLSDPGLNYMGYHSVEYIVSNAQLMIMQAYGYEEHIPERN